jgi:hypothetical protein
MPAPEHDKRQAAREVIDILHEIATILVKHFQPSTMAGSSNGVECRTRT